MVTTEIIATEGTLAFWMGPLLPYFASSCHRLPEEIDRKCVRVKFAAELSRGNLVSRKILIDLHNFHFKLIEHQE